MKKRIGEKNIQIDIHRRHRHETRRRTQFQQIDIRTKKLFTIVRFEWFTKMIRFWNILNENDFSSYVRDELTRRIACWYASRVVLFSQANETSFMIVRTSLTRSKIIVRNFIADNWMAASEFFRMIWSNFVIISTGKVRLMNISVNFNEYVVLWKRSNQVVNGFCCSNTSQRKSKIIERLFERLLMYSWVMNLKNLKQNKHSHSKKKTWTSSHTVAEDRDK